ncbi:fimbrial protein [Paenibacillus zeisoli]|uniref:Fimbrial protein n=1 Tax=Paenibacillus zeisoli TaxID=2496267 RepID=A0A433XC95_9BACL|nr:pilus assembly protein PilM [Paenibacillus zeisoli]RUT31703.1 fimbrial protein [Paenibacillus zeisoli]
MHTLGSKKWIGLTIEQNGVRYIKLKKNKSWEMETRSFLPLQPGMIIENEIADKENFRELLQNWVQEKGLKGSEVSLSIPPSQIIIRRMTIPSTNAKQVEQLVKLEVETALHLPFENPVYDYLPIRKDEENTHLLVFAAPRRLVEDYVELLADAGIKVSAVETSATALARAIGVGRSESFTETMLIHQDGAHLDIYMFHAGQPIFMRSINLNDMQPNQLAGFTDGSSPIDPDGFESANQSRISAEQMVEITAEISRMLNFYQYSLHDGETRITEIIITGSRTGQQQMLEELQLAIGDMNIRTVNFDRLTSEAAADPELNAYRIAIGAAIRRTDAGALDLLPREDREAQLYPVLMASILILWIFGAIAVGILYVTNRDTVNEQAVRIQELNDNKTLLMAELAKLNTKGQPTDPKLVINTILKSRMDAVAVLDQLNKPMPQGGAIVNIGYTQNTEITLTANFVKMEDASVYLSQLRKLPFAVSMQIDKLSEDMAEVGNLPTRVYAAVYKIRMTNEKQTQEGGTE